MLGEEDAGYGRGGEGEKVEVGSGHAAARPTT